MTMRVALLAAECEPWAKTGGLADVVDALARALGRLPEAGTGSRPRWTCSCRATGRVPVPGRRVDERPLGIADPRTGRPLTVSVVNVPADGYRLRLVDVPARSTATPSTTTRTTRGGSPSSAAPRWPRSAATARPLDVLHVHDWHTGPALLERARGDAARDPFFAGMAVVLTLHNLAYHGWRPRTTSVSWAWRPVTASRAPTRTASTCC